MHKKYTEEYMDLVYKRMCKVDNLSIPQFANAYGIDQNAAYKIFRRGKRIEQEQNLESI